MAAKFEIKAAKNGEFVFNLHAANGQVIATGGETYSSVDACKTGVESVRKNCAVHVEDQTVAGFETLAHPKYELYKDKGGEFRYRLHRPQRTGRACGDRGISEHYPENVRPCREKAAGSFYPHSMSRSSFFARASSRRTAALSPSKARALWSATGAR